MNSYRLIHFINKMTSVVTNRFHEVSIFKNSSAEREVYFCEVYFDCHHRKGYTYSAGKGTVLIRQ